MAKRTVVCIAQVRAVVLLRVSQLGELPKTKSISIDSTTTGSSSPSKRTVDKRTYIEYLDPPTKFVTPRQWEIDEAAKPVKCLWREYIRKEDTGQDIGIIPRKLQVCICSHNNLNARSQSALFYLGSDKVIHRHAEQENPRCSCYSIRCHGSLYRA